MNVEYPEIQPLLAAKALRRQELAVLSWEQKVAIIERMRSLLPVGAWRKCTLTTPDLEFADSTDRVSSAAVTAQEAEIDRLVYALYGLTAAEIKIVEGE